MIDSGILGSISQKSVTIGYMSLYYFNKRKTEAYKTRLLIEGARGETFGEDLRTYVECLLGYDNKQSYKSLEEKFKKLIL